MRFGHEALVRQEQVDGLKSENIDSKYGFRPEEAVYDIFTVREMWKEQNAEELFDSIDFDAPPAKIIHSLMVVREFVAKFNESKIFLEKDKRDDVENMIKSLVSKLLSIKDNFSDNYFVSLYINNFIKDVERCSVNRFDFETSGQIEIKDGYVKCLSLDGHEIKIEIGSSQLLENLCNRYESSLSTFEENKGSSFGGAVLDTLMVLRFSIVKMCRNIDLVDRVKSLGYRGDVELEEYLVLNSLEFNTLLKNELHIEIEKLTIFEQFELIGFLKKLDINNANRFKDFSEKFGLEGQRVFLSLQFGRDIGFNILTFSEKFPEEKVKLVFDKYCKVIDGVFKLEELMPELPNKSELIGKAREHLLMRARNLLFDFVVKLNIENLSDDVLEKEFDNLFSKIKNVDTYNQAVVSTINAIVKENNDVDIFEIFDSLTFEEISVGSMSGQELDEMKALYSSNYSSVPKLGKRLLEDFEGILKEKGQTIQVLKHENKIIGFYLYTKRGDGGLEFRAFNVDFAYSGAGIGKEMMIKELNDTAYDNVVHATCNAELPISSEYIESGFVGIGYGHLDEINYLDIVRCDKKRYFHTKDMEPDYFINKLGEGDRYEDDKLIIVKDVNLAKVGLDRSGMRLDDGKSLVLTRYMKQNRDNKKEYCVVFEKVSIDLLNEYQIQK